MKTGMGEGSCSVSIARIRRQMKLNRPRMEVITRQDELVMGRRREPDGDMIGFVRRCASVSSKSGRIWLRILQLLDQSGFCHMRKHNACKDMLSIVIYF